MRLALPLITAPALPARPLATGDAVLLGALRGGDPEAFRLLIERHQSGVFSLLSRMGFDRDTAEDLAQDAFVRAWKALPTFRGDAQLSTWLYRIVYRQALQHLRQRGRHQRLAAEATALREVIECLPDGHAQTELRETLDRCLATLPAPQRLALGLFYFQEQSYEEVAGIMQLPLNTVKTHIRRGKLRLRELLEGAPA